MTEISHLEAQAKTPKAILRGFRHIFMNHACSASSFIGKLKTDAYDVYSKHKSVFRATAAGTLALLSSACSHLDHPSERFNAPSATLTAPEASTAAQHTATKTWPAEVAIDGMYDQECYPFTVSENRQGLGEFASNIVRILSEVPAGQTLVSTAQRHEIPICFDAINAFGYYDPENKKMIINPFFSYSGTMPTVAHELRHVQQDLDFDIVDMFDLSLSIQTSTAINKIAEADAEAYQNLVTYQLAELGYSFEHIFDYKEDRKLYIPLAKAFYDELPRRRVANDSDIARAMRATFRAWLEHDKLNTIYEASTADFFGYNTLGQEGVCFGDDVLSVDMKSFEAVIASITRMPNGQSYTLQTGGIHAFSGYFNRYADATMHETEQLISDHVEMNRCSTKRDGSNAAMSRKR